jgi:hypothetical protein
MSYWVRAGLGLALFLAGFAAFEYGLWELMNTGTCASGGPYVSARPCPEGTAEKALLLPGGFILGFIGVAVFAMRGRRPGAPEDARRLSPWLMGWTPLFLGTGVVALVAGLQAEGPQASTAQWTGIFLAAMFIPMGLAPLIATLAFGSSRKRSNALTNEVIRNAARAASSRQRPAAPRPQPSPPTPAPGPSGDPLERLRKLGELRDQGVLSPDEFAAAKSRILAEL